MKKLTLLKSLLVLIGVLITSLTTNVWGSTWMEEPVVVINGTDYSASSLTSLSLGTQTDIAVTWVHWYGKRNNKTSDGMWAEGKFTYGISGETGTAETWNDITVSGSEWYDDYKTVYINTNIDFQLCSNRKPGEYELYFFFQHRTGESSYIYYSNNSSNYHVTWTLPEPTIEFSNNHTAVVGQPVTLSTAVSDWPYGMTIKKVTYKHDGTAIQTITSGDLSSTSYTHTPTVSGTGKYTVEVICTFGTAGDVTYTRSMDVTASYDVTYGSHTNGSFTIAVPNVDASSESKYAASTQRVDIAATGDTGYEFSSWDIYKTGTPATKITPNASTATTYFTMPAYAVTVDATFVGKHYDVTLNPDNGNSTSAIYPQYTAAMPSTLKAGGALSAPSYSGYDFQGYFDDHAGAGNQYYTNTMGSANNWDKTSTATLYAKWTQDITLDQNGANKDGSTSLSATYKATLSTGGITNPNKIGYAFAGWTATKDGSDVVIEADGTVNTVDSWTDNNKKWIHTGSSTLYAKWTADVNNFKADAGTNAWGTASNWSQNKVPTDYTEVHIKGNVTVSSHEYVGSVVIEEGTLTISAAGALEVEGGITNSNDAKLVVEPCGALIYSGSTNASVQMFMSSGWHLVALPVYGVRVSSAFAGEGVYTYAWNNTAKAWDRRGYYEDLMGNEAILVMGSTGYTFSGSLISTGDGGGGLTYDGSKANGDANLFGNSFTAPIKVSGMTISGSPDGSPHIFNGSSWTGLNSGDVIPAMQGYAILASSGGGSFSYSYATAVRNATSPNAPLQAPKRTKADIQEHMTIYVTDDDWSHNIRLYENAQFSDSIDKGYEAIHMEGEGFAGELYAQGLERKMNILAVPDLEGTVVGFVPGQAENYTISFEGDGKGYYINDTKMGQATLIEEGNTYDFTPGEGDNSTRFVISRTPIAQIPTDVDAINDGVKARKQMIDGVLYIIRDGRIYDVMGKSVK